MKEEWQMCPKLPECTTKRTVKPLNEVRNMKGSINKFGFKSVVEHRWETGHLQRN